MSVGRVEGSVATALVNVVEAMLVRAHRASGRSSGQSANRTAWGGTPGGGLRQTKDRSRRTRPVKVVFEQSRC